ncbi:MAG TPA: ABC transporter substrate-binding protein [Beijerinckiaceae bacterium]|nr:ABC transporter substrate-binding protein [Beijerinckiaceae bacterium]
MGRTPYAALIAAAAALLLAHGVSAPAQQPKHVYRIGMLRVDTAADPRAQGLTDVFRQGLRELGYVEGKDVVIDYRHAGGQLDRLPKLAADLVATRPDVIVAQGTPGTLALKQATSSIPIVVGGAGDLVGAGLVASLARPGGNITGSTNIDPDLSAKRLALLKEALPRVSRVAVLYHGSPGGDAEELRENETAARALGLELLPLRVEADHQFEDAFAAIARERSEAVVILHGSFTLTHRRQLIELAAKSRLPVMSGEASWPEAGALISYGYDRRHQWRRAAHFVHKILHGARPADLPVEQPLKFELTVNLQTAAALGLNLPRTLLARADVVIR